MGAAMDGWGASLVLLPALAGAVPSGLASFMALQMAAMDAASSHPGVSWLGGWLLLPLWHVVVTGEVPSLDFWNVPGVVSRCASASFALRWCRWTVRPRLCGALRLLLWLFTQRDVCVLVKLSGCVLGSRMPFDIAGDTAVVL